jgi:hypothetical protein
MEYHLIRLPIRLQALVTRGTLTGGDVEDYQVSVVRAAAASVAHYLDRG